MKLTEEEMKQKVKTTEKYAPLIYNSDIIAIKKKMKTNSISDQEMEILKHEGLLEWQIQSTFRRICLALNNELQLKKLGKVEFRQNDNGGKLSAAGKIRKFKEGTVSGMMDIAIYAYSNKKKANKTFFVEVKRVGATSQVIISQEQSMQHKLFLEMGFNTYVTNNTLYFREVICKAIVRFVGN